MLFRPFVDFLSRLGKPVQRTRRVVRRLPLCERLEDRALLSVDAVLVKDINTQQNVTMYSPSQMTDVNGTVFFAGFSNGAGEELWKSDGTAAGTVLVKDINPGLNCSVPRHLTNVNGTLYFSADNGVGGQELWKSDGSAAGTVLVKDIHAGSTGSELQKTNKSQWHTVFQRQRWCCR